jgi:hypothetical protein
MFWLVSMLFQHYDDALNDVEWEVLDELRARLKHVVDPIEQYQIDRRIEGLDWAYPGYEHTYTVSGPIVKWFARPKDDPSAQPIPFKRNWHPASARFDRFPGEKKNGRRYA